MSAPLTPAALLTACDRLHAAAEGRFSFEIIRRPARAAALFAAVADAEVAMLVAVEDFLDRCAAEGTLCVRCPRGLTARPGAVILVRAAAVNATGTLALGVCTRCALGRTDRALGLLAISALREIFPDLHETGRSRLGGWSGH